MTREFRFHNKEQAEEQLAIFEKTGTTFGSKALDREIRRYKELGDAYPFKSGATGGDR
jgi:hypothetical protein